jgi:hypothetical protein
MSSKNVTLHEQLAIETALENQANKCRVELASTFEKKRHLFEEKQKVFTPLKEGQKPEITVESTIQTSVGEELGWVQTFIVKALNASLQVSVANQSAVANIVLETGETLATNVPATALLELEKRVNEIKNLVEAIPTLDPAKGFAADATHAKRAFKAREVRKPRTQKVKDVLVAVQATEHHPAQCQIYDKDELIGHVEEQEWSTLITPADKADLINRVEILARAVKAARSRANNTEVDRSREYGGALLNYVFNGKA